MDFKFFLSKYKNIISYLFFGVVTTVVNVATYYLCYDIAKISNMMSTCIAWMVAVAVAFITNKLFVFESKSWEKSIAFKEATNFVLCRVGTGVVEVLMMYIFVDILSFHGTIMKIITNIVVIILNYIVSKIVIFKEKGVSL